jgi:hypothetical protein
MIDRRSLTLSALALFAGPAAAATSPRPSAPTETVWKPADTPPGGVAWSLLESTKEITRTDSDGFIVSKPDFPAAVRALNGKSVKVSGSMMPLENGARQTHFVLLAYPPDCPYHLNPNPTQFIEVKAKSGLPFDYKVKTIQGKLELHGQDESGIFYKIFDATPV